jgi:excisionase family DNA binding protein
MVDNKGIESQKLVATAICYDCKNFRGAKLGTCLAFPDGIPGRIWSGKVRHDKPFPGDLGTRFQPNDLSEFLSVSELAKVLGLNPKTIYRAVWSKMLPAYRFGRTWRISKRDIESFRK